MQITRAAIPHLESAAQKFGQASIVTMSSSVGFQGFPGDTAYATTKSGLIGFTRALAKELARKNITVNALTPGYINVGVTDEVPQKGRDMMLERIPLGRPGTADEVAAAVAFLVSEGTYITGHMLDIDGGIEL
jgi:3-oxoacyl-[acyl-carrier protein] reductase